MRRAPTRTPQRRSESTDARARADGAAFGFGGWAGWLAWRNRGALRSNVDAVPAASWRGALKVAIWLIVAALLGAALSWFMPGPRGVWYTVALVVMLAVTWWWERRIS